MHLFKLKEEARDSTGQVHLLLGNHEVRNADLDFRYVTQNAWEGWKEPPLIWLDTAGHQGPTVTTICVSSSYYNLLYYYMSVLFILLLHLYYYIGKP